MDMKTWVASKGLQQACKYIGKDPETNIPKLMELVDKFAGDSYQSQRDAIRKVVNDPGFQLVPAHLFLVGGRGQRSAVQAL